MVVVVILNIIWEKDTKVLAIKAHAQRFY